MRRWARGAMFVWLVALVSLGPAGASAQGSGERIRDYEVAIDIAPDGDLVVVERIVYDFDGTEHHGIFRDIPVRFHYDDRYDRVYPVQVFSVMGSTGTPDQYDNEKSGNEMRIKIGDPDRTVTGVHVYTITYGVEGALNGFADHDELYWNAVGTNWGVPVDKAAVQVKGPAGALGLACFAGPRLASLPCGTSLLQDGVATFSQDGLDPYEGLTVVVGFPKGSVPAPRPVLEERWSLGRAFSATPLTLGVAGGLLALLLAGVGYMLWANGRDRRAVGSPVDVAYGTSQEGEQAVPLFEQGTYPVEYAPPDGIRPGQVGTLIDEVANPLDVTATIVDLAVRRYLRIEEIPKRWVFGKPDWRLVKLKEGDDDLVRYERLLLDGLFEDADEDFEPELTEAELELLKEYEEPARPDLSARPDVPAPPTPRDDGLAQVKLSNLRRKFAPRLRRVQNALYEDAVKGKWFAGRPDNVRRTWHIAGFAVLAAGIVLTWLAAAKTHLGLITIPIALAGLLLTWAARWMPRRTPKGTGLVRRVLGFRTYIDTAEAQEAHFQEQENLFSKYLPYAIVFGCTEKWARAFRGLDQQVPSTAGWYVGTHPLSVASFASSIGHFSSVAAGTFSSAAATGSSGFGGGGFSGGGGGGGGGGSW